MTFDKPLCAALDGFTLHAATRAGALDFEGREALLKYVLRPAVAQERVTHAPGGLVRITLKRPFGGGTVAVDIDPLSLLWRRIVPQQQNVEQGGAGSGPADSAKALRKGSRYRPWAELLKRTFRFEVLCCPTCNGRMTLIAMVTEPKSVTRFLRGIGEPREAPERVPARGPSTVRRQMSLGDAA
jgi:hypothetical protein